MVCVTVPQKQCFDGGQSSKALRSYKTNGISDTKINGKCILGRKLIHPRVEDGYAMENEY